MRIDTRGRAIIIWTLLSLVALVTSLGRLSIDPVASVDGGQANLESLWPFWISSGMLWLGLTAIWWRLHRDGRTGDVGATVVILAVAVMARLAVLFMHTPTLSDDIYRYVFDGRNSVASTNPYRVLPESRQAVSDANARWPMEAELAGRVNNETMYTIYLPTSQVAFAITARLLPEGASLQTHVRAFRGAMIIFELAAICLLLVVVGARGRSPWWVALYAWHPMALTEIAGSGHQESIGILLLVLALTIWTRWPKSQWRWTIPLAAASLVKPFVVPIAALMLRGRNCKTWAFSIVTGAMTCALLALPFFAGAAGEVIANLRDTSTRFSLKWAHFGSVYEPVLSIIERLTPTWSNDPQEQLGRAICVGLAALTLLIIILRRTEPWRGARLMMMAMVLLSPVVHPWYLLWALILVPATPGLAVWIASLTLPWGYIAWRYAVNDQGDLGWFVPTSIMVGAYVPVYVALLVSVIKPRK